MPFHGLHYQSLNPLASHTLLLLHGAFSSHNEWALASAHLSSYHLLIPDLPSHGRDSSATIPFNIPDTAALLADLITKHAKNGKADIVGMSLGGYTAIYIAQKYPDLIGDGGLFISGCGKPWPKPGSFLTWGSGLAMFFSGWMFTHLPKSWFDWICAKSGIQVGAELLTDMKTAATYQMGQAVTAALAEDPEKKGRNWKDLSEGTKVRTCVVAGVLEDGEQDCLIRGEQLNRGNSESRAFKVEGRRHAWDLQDPELFARGILAWMDHQELPEQYINLIKSDG